MDMLSCYPQQFEGRQWEGGDVLPREGVGSKRTRESEGTRKNKRKIEGRRVKSKRKRVGGGRCRRERERARVR